MQKKIKGTDVNQEKILVKNIDSGIIDSQTIRKKEVACILNQSTERDFCDYVLCDIISKMDEGNYESLTNKKIFEDISFVRNLNEYIDYQLENIIDNQNVHTFNEISKYISLLGMGEYHEIIVDLNNCNFKDLELLFNEYLEKLTNADSKELFDTIFKSLIMLYKSLNCLCILDQVNTYRKRQIPKMVEEVTNSIKSFETNLIDNEYFDNKNKNYLKNYLGLFDVNFTHYSYIEIGTKTFDDLVGEFYTNSIRQISGLHKSMNSEYGNNLSKEGSVHGAFLGNFAYSLSLLLYKIREEDYDKLLKNENFDMILHHLGDYFGDYTKFEGSSIDEIKSFCNNVFCGLYRGYDPETIGENLDSDYNNLIEEYISDSEKLLSGVSGIIDGSNLETIYNLVTLNKIDVKLLYKLGLVLLESDVFSNYSYEFYKLKIVDIIISELSGENELLDDFIEKIIIYVDLNKTASQLFYVYTSLYFTIAYIYSNKIEYYDLTIEYILNFLKYNENIEDFLSRYDTDKLYKNIGRNYLLISQNTDNLDFDLPDEFLINIGKSQIDKEDLHIKGIHTINTEKKLNEILDRAIEHDEKYSEDFLLRQLSNLLSDEIFLGLPHIEILKSSSIERTFKCRNGESLKTFSIDDNYNLKFTYPTLYEDIFSKMYDENMLTIIPKILNIIKRYNEMEELLYKDFQTGLPNDTKLKLFLNNNEEPKTFISIKLMGLSKIEARELPKDGLEYIQRILEKLQELGNVYGFTIYRLSNSKIGLLLNETDNIDLHLHFLLEDINKISIEFRGSHISVPFKIGYVQGEKKGILRKSSIALNYSLNTNENSYKYKGSDLDKEKGHVDWEYLQALNEAIDNDQIFPYFQLIKNLQTGSEEKYEALFRVNINGEVRGPFPYLKVAEKHGRLKKVTEIMIKKVFEYANENPEKSFNINLSGEDFKDDKIFDLIQLSLDNNVDVKSENITLEILESIWSVEEEEEIISKVSQLKKLGFKIALDDYGSSHSNINRLNKLGEKGLLDFVKLDGDLVLNLESRITEMPEGRELNRMINKSAAYDIENIVRKSELYGFKVVAEHISSQELLTKVEMIGVHYGQGFFISVPHKNLDVVPE